MAISHQVRKKGAVKKAGEIRARVLDAPAVGKMAASNLATEGGIPAGAVLAEIAPVAEVASQVCGERDRFAVFVEGRGVSGAASALGVSRNSVKAWVRKGAPRNIRLAVWALERGAEV